MKVAKFGGSSVADASMLKKVANIITSDSDRKFIIVSAPGKRNKTDIKVTDLFIELGEKFFQKEDIDGVREKILDRFGDILTALELGPELLGEINSGIEETLYNERFAKNRMDALKAMGEDTLAKILSAYLQQQGYKASYVNPKEAGIIVSEEPSSAQVLEESYEQLFTLREREGILIIPGFFGYTKSGELNTFPRGGSDITGSIVAAGVKADLYENFTDVDSVYCVNPTIVQNPKEISVLTYKEMRELSYAGFSVFHDEALIPAFKAKIPVCVKNTNNPTKPGTMIVADREKQKGTVIGIASSPGFLSLYVSKYLMNREIGFGKNLLQILVDEGISFEHAPSGIDDMSVIIRESQLSGEKEKIIMVRFIALLIVLIPGVIATLGIKIMRDALFNIVYPFFFSVVVQFIIGLLLFLGGIAFIGGFILHRDKKNNKTKGNFRV